MTDVTLRANGRWLGTQTGAGGATTLTSVSFGRRQWLRG